MNWQRSLATLIWIVVTAPRVFAQAGLDQKGEYLARAADCVACHSTSDGKPFAGGLKMGTPLGAIYSTNITPDPETGIGNYSPADFDRAVRQGIAKDGRRLYPAMPYTSYSKITDEDIAALYSYFTKEVPAVRQENRPAEIRWPWNIRWPMAIWNVFFFDNSPYKPNPARDEVWNRGAYLVQGLGHCGACHTPRGLALQEKALDDSDQNFLGGAVLDGWFAPSLRGDYNDGLARWTEADIISFLKAGRNDHAGVFGSMLDAYNDSTQFLADGDLLAIARYLKSMPGKPGQSTPWVYDGRTAGVLATPPSAEPGAAIYLAQCGACHGRDGNGEGQSLPPLAGNPIVLSDDPSSVINLVLNGTGRVVTHDVPDLVYMRPYRLVLDDAQIADVVNFIRNAWGNQASRIERQAVSQLRESTNMASDRVTILKMR